MLRGKEPIGNVAHISYSHCSRKELSFSMLSEVKVKALVAQSCLTFCDPMDYSLPDSSVQGILQARILEWAAFPFSRGSSQPRDRTQVSRIVGGFFTS